MSSFTHLPTEVDCNEDVEEKEVTKKQKCQTWTYHHLSVFLLTFFSYALIHATRKTFSNVKFSLMSTWTPQSSDSDVYQYKTWNSHNLFKTNKEAEYFMGTLDAIFMFSYAIGLYISGVLGDRIDPRIVLSIGMWGAGIINVIFGSVTEWTHFYSIPLYIILWILNGFLQSTGWPAVVCVMGNWFGKGSRGFVLGIWSSCASVGNIIGSYFGALVLPYGYEYTFLVNSTLLFAFGFVIHFGLVSHPREVGLPEPVESHDSANVKLLSSQQPVGTRPQAISFWRAVLLPGVIAYSLAYAFLKLVNYSIFFWLPYYMTNALHWDESVADKVSTWYDWGGIVGGIIGGLISDWLGKRSPVVVAQLLLSIGALFAYIKIPNDTVINGFVMGVAGFFGNGAANLISAACTADLGRQEGVRGNAEALSTVTGIVDGTGSIGAALGQVIIPVLYQVISWNAVFYMFIVMTFLTAVCLAKLCYQETKDIYHNFKMRHYTPLPVDETC